MEVKELKIETAKQYIKNGETMMNSNSKEDLGMKMGKTWRRR